MGGKSSKEESWGRGSSFRSTSSSSWNSYPQSTYDRSQPYEPPPSYSSQQYYIPPPQNYDHEPYAPGRVAGDNRNKLERRYSRIADNYNSLEEVRDALIIEVTFVFSWAWDYPIFLFFPELKQFSWPGFFPSWIIYSTWRLRIVCHLFWHLGD